MTKFNHILLDHIIDIYVFTQICRGEPFRQRPIITVGSIHLELTHECGENFYRLLIRPLSVEFYRSLS